MTDGARDAEYFKSRCPRICTRTEDASCERDRERLRERLANRARGVALLEVGAAPLFDMRGLTLRMGDGLALCSSGRRFGEGVDSHPHWQRRHWIIDPGLCINRQRGLSSARRCDPAPGRSLAVPSAAASAPGSPGRSPRASRSPGCATAGCSASVALTLRPVWSRSSSRLVRT